VKAKYAAEMRRTQKKGPVVMCGHLLIQTEHLEKLYSKLWFNLSVDAIIVMVLLR